ncbi:MAG: hypothetical protein ABI894_16735 [Ilumatobacteraceae bacterium]
MNDLDPLISQAMARVAQPTDARPSVSDVHRRARRHNRRRMTATVGAVACAGLASAALLIRRDGDSTRTVASGAAGSTDEGVGATTTFPLALGGPTTLAMAPQLTIDASTVWDALANLEADPSAAGMALVPLPGDVDRAHMPTAEMFGCTTDACATLFNYVVWHQVGSMLGFFDVQQMRDMNSGIDFSKLPQAGDVLQTVSSSFYPPATTMPGDETPTTISVFDGVMLIDGGAPVGAMNDAFGRLAGFNRTIFPSSGKTVDKTVLMRSGINDSMASAVGSVLGIGGVDNWDASFVGDPSQGMVAVVIGPDYWDLVQNQSPPVGAVYTTTSPAPTSTSIQP